MRKKKQLGHDDIRYMVGDFSADEDDSVFKQTRIDIHGALSAACIFNDIGSKGKRWSVFRCSA